MVHVLKQCIMTLQSSKVVDFGTNRKCVWDFLLILNSNLAPTDIRVFVCQKPLLHITPIFRSKFWGVPFGVDP